MMKKKAILLNLLGFVSLIGLNNSYADTATDPQSVILTVPEVTLFNVKTNLSVNLAPPTQAGQSFTQPGSGAISYAITSNIATGKTRVLNAKIDQDLDGIVLKVSAFALPGSTSLGYVSLSTTDQPILIEISNILAGFDEPLSTIFYRIEPQQMLPYGSTIVNVTYTLADDA